jgi:prolipoprotein diacylglyceryltransferase
MEPIPGCSGDYCYQLSTPVYPTPIYEALMALILFAGLWFWLRHKNFKPGQIFSIYMIFAGVERFAIESIREHGDSLYRIAGMVFSQAQMISIVLIVLGTCGYFIFNKQQQKVNS